MDSDIILAEIMSHSSVIIYNRKNKFLATFKTAEYVSQMHSENELNFKLAKLKINIPVITPLSCLKKKKKKLNPDPRLD